MKKGILFYIILLSMFLSAFPAFAQEQTAARQDLWVSTVVESGFYALSSVAFGGGAALGYGDGAAFGIRVIYYNDFDSIQTLELNFLFRLYFFGTAANTGPFIQLNGGPVIFALYDNLALPSKAGTISAGLSLGWRFLLGNSFFLEPVIRGGYPYAVGAALSAGIRF